MTETNDVWDRDHDKWYITELHVFQCRPVIANSHWTRSPCNLVSDGYAGQGDCTIFLHACLPAGNLDQIPTKDSHHFLTTCLKVSLSHSSNQFNIVLHHQSIINIHCIQLLHSFWKIFAFFWVCHYFQMIKDHSLALPFNFDVATEVFGKWGNERIDKYLLRNACHRIFIESWW